MSWAERIGSFCAGLSCEQIPAAVLDRACLLGLDSAGLALYAGQGAYGQKLEGWLGENGEGTCKAPGLSASAPPSGAAFATAALIHAVDFDDTHTEAFLHPSAVVWGTALSLAQAYRPDLDRFLSAIVAGYEVMIQLGLAARGGFNWRGFHSTSVLGAVAGAVVAAKMRQAGAAETAAAVGTAAGLAAGLLEGLRDGSDAKMLQVGWAARLGVIAAGYGLRGFISPRLGLEGEYGLFRSHLAHLPEEGTARLAALGREWRTLEVIPKFYPACHHIHSFMDAVQAAAAKPGFDPGQVKRVICSVAAEQVPVVCEPAVARRRPATPYAARFSLPYCVGLVLSGRDGGLTDFEKPVLRDPDVLRRAAQVQWEVVPRPEFPARFPAKICIEFRDGKTMEAALPSVRGQAGREVTPADVRGKFENLTGFLGAERQKRIEEAFLALPRQKGLTGLLEALRLA